MEQFSAGIDVGTTGARAVIIDSGNTIRGDGKIGFSQSERRDPDAWWQAAAGALEAALSHVPREQVASIAVSATSGSVVAIDGDGKPDGPVFMYSDPCPDETVLAAIRRYAPDWTPARGGTGGLGCALVLAQRKPARVAHQADWINHKLTGVWLGDSSSALKSGFDPVAGHWPDWVTSLGLGEDIRVPVRASGEALAPISDVAAERFGLSPETRIIAGTTDGCASFMATGASQVGEAVTVLGTTLTLKILSDKPVFDPTSGVYSHLVSGMWLAGGASNAGGGVLLDHFDVQTLSKLSSQIDVSQPTDLDYYPLAKSGERFPVADAEMQPRLTPRPASDSVFLQGMLEGLSRIEAAAYAKLHNLGAPMASRIFATGGGTQNKAWMAIRDQVLDAPLAEPFSIEAASGVALMARRGLA